MRRRVMTTEETPKMIDDELYALLRAEKIEEFNAQRTNGAACELTGLDFRGVNLRGMNVERVSFANSYFRQGDLSGLNLSDCNLEGASLGNAKISGTLFPRQLSAQEIMMSVRFGTRLRYGT